MFLRTTRMTMARITYADGSVSIISVKDRKINRKALRRPRVMAFYFFDSSVIVRDRYNIDAFGPDYNFSPIFHRGFPVDAQAAYCLVKDTQHEQCLRDAADEGYEAFVYVASGCAHSYEEGSIVVIPREKEFPFPSLSGKPVIS